MLDLFRQRGLSSIVYSIVIAATILVFVIQFRPNSNQKTASLKEACVAVVRGQCVDPKDYKSSYRLMMPREQDGTPSPKKARAMGLPRMTLDGLVERELLCGEAEQLGLKVTEDEVTDQIFEGWIHVSVPAADAQAAARVRVHDGEIYAGFKNKDTKQFDMKVYERTIRNIAGRSPTEFREEQAREILAAKMRELVLAAVRVSDTEAENLYIDQKSTATVTTIPLKQAWVKRWAVTANDADVAAWAKDETVGKEVEGLLKDRETADMPKENHVRHILAKLAPNPGDDDVRKAAQKLARARARILAGASFAETAREMSDDKMSAFQGGDFGDKTMSPSFQDAVNALKPGEMTKTAIQTPFGLELIMKDDPSKEAEVRASVMKDLQRELYLKRQALDKTKELAAKMRADVAGGKKPEDVVLAAIAAVAKQPAPPAPMDVTRLPQATADADGGTAPKSSSASSTDENTPAGDQDRPQVVVTSPFGRGGDPIAGLSNEAKAQLVDFAFSAKPGDWMKDALRTDDGFTLVSLKESKIATHDDFVKDKEQFLTMLLAAKRAEAMSLHVKRLRDQAKDQIKIDESYIAELRTDAGVESPEDEDEGP
jgi:peptidyl-prolyl cis-trans isomerase D